MSSSYSPDLRIELIGTGDQAGVWGSTTNNNLAYVLEQAIAGYVSVSVISSGQALTYLNGGTATAADNQSVHASLALTTTTGANFAVYAPPSSKQYTIYNASSYVATIYNSTVIGNTTAAGTGVAIPAGKTMAIWSDGTNFTQQNDHLISPTIASPTITTPTMSSPTMTGTPIAPTASTGTNTTQVATTAFVQGEKASPAFTGTPTAPTASYGTNTTQLATTAFVQAALQALYPVGSIYSSTVSTNPNTLFGFGTWVAYAAGRVMIGNGGGFTAGDTGGSADAITVAHTHTASTAITDPGHTHFTGVNLEYYPYGVNTARYGYGDGWTSARTNNTNGPAGYDTYTSTASTGVTAATTVTSTGSSGTGANLQPYVVVYMWNRTA
jgi:hypothetical protein